MMMDKNQKLDAELDALFKSDSAGDDLPSDALFSMILADADGVMAEDLAVTPTPKTRKPFWQRFGFAGQEMAVGMSLAGCAALGVFVGYSSPDILTDFGVITTGVDTASDFGAWGSDTVLNVFDAYFVES